MNDVTSAGNTRPVSAGSHAGGGSRRSDQLAPLLERLESARQAGDRGTVIGLLSREFIHIDAAGRKSGGAEAIQALLSEPNEAAADRVVRDYGLISVVISRSADGPAGANVMVQAWEHDRDGWKLLVQHANLIAASDAPRSHPPMTPRSSDAPAPACANPCEFVPYEPKSDAEREIVKSFGLLERAVTQNDAETWSRYFADEFLVFRTGQHPTTKEGRMDMLRRGKAVNAETWVAEVEDLRFWVRGDAAVMMVDHRMPADRRPPYRATRIWVKRDGRWQMALAQQTTRKG